MRSRKISLRQAMRVGESDSVALVGAGGKTSLLFGLAREFEGPVVLSATTHLGIEQLTLADRHVTVHDDADLLQFELGFPEGVTLLTGEEGDDARTKGLDQKLIAKVYELTSKQNVPFIIEADGARMLPIKAPAGHEPPIPAFVDLVIVVAGLSALGHRIRDVVHRPDRFCTLVGKGMMDIVEIDDAASLLMDKNGGLKNIPESARKVVLLNQTRSDQQKIAAKAVSGKLLSEYNQVISADVVPLRRPLVNAVYERISGVVLAAGGSERMGKTKQLLEYKGQSLIRNTVETALKSDLDELIVVVGSNAESVRNEISDLPVTIVDNSAWQDGQSSSVKAGVMALNKNTGGAVFLLADQPFMTETLINEILQTHQRTFQPVTLPLINGRRGNPALFDMRTFPDLLNLEGDSGGRQLFSKFEIEYVQWVDPMVNRDIDTPDDYNDLLEGQI